MQTLNLIAGRSVRAARGGTFPVTDPATDELLAEVPDGGTEDARQAIEAAAAALPKWRALTADQRAAPLRRLADAMMVRQEELALLMTREQGKPLSEARGEIAYAASFLHWAAEEGKRLYGEIIPASTADKRILVLRQPVGVCGAITPWNFPAAMITRKLGPALACGCTMVIKPARQTPLSALAIGELCNEAGVPPGVVNVVAGDAQAIGGEMFANPLVRKVSFTGSTKVGKQLMRQAAEHVTRLSLELGGHAPLVVFDDADLEAAVQGAIANKFRNAGQTCICANRIYAQAGIYSEFVERLAAEAGQLRVGRGTDEGVAIGPLIDDAAVSKVESHVADARDKGGRIILGGSLLPPREGMSRRFFAPTVIADFTPDMLLASEETFGPVAPVARFETEAEAVAACNDSLYGLAAYFYTSDASRLLRFAEALDYGIVGANDAAPSTAQAPFGGMKASGIGREGGKYVMNEYSEIKYVSWRL